MPELTEQQKLHAEKDARTKERLLDQTEVNYTPVSLQAGKACAGCRWFEPAESWGDGEDRIPSCHLVNSWPQSIQPTGYCDRYEVIPVPQPFTQTPIPVVIVESDEIEVAAAELGARVERGVVEKLVKAFKGVIEKALPQPEPQIGGFKVFKDASGQYRWMAWYSNNFEDREKEFFREKGFDRYVQRLDMGLVEMPEYWTWHTRGTKAGVADWVDRIGHFHVATGTYDDTPIGQSTKAYDIEHQKEFGVSHGFLYRGSDVEIVDGKKVYNDWNTFEISTLPLHRAANELTAFAVEQSEGIKEVKMDAEKRKMLVAKYASLGGETFVAKLETEAESRGKEIEPMRGFKDFVDPDGNTEVTGNKEAIEQAVKAFNQFIPQLIEDNAEAVLAGEESAKAIATMQTENAELRKQVKELGEQVAAIRDGAPRASQSSKTIIKETDALATKSQLGLTPDQEALSEALPGLFKQG